MIDTHCHIDLYPNPKEVADLSESLGIPTLVMTNLPSHFEIGHEHLLGYKKVRLALGMHPLYAQHHENEYPLFVKNINKTSYIGEVGLDFSFEGINTKATQIEYFNRVLSAIGGEKKLISLHSRKAESEVLKCLKEQNSKLAIFHWYSGALKLIDQIASDGYYFSINPAMVASDSGRKIIKRIPADLILTESDGPFTSWKGKPCLPSDVKLTYDYLSQIWSMSILEVESKINENFKGIISQLK